MPEKQSEMSLLQVQALSQKELKGFQLTLSECVCYSCVILCVCVCVCVGVCYFHDGRESEHTTNNRANRV